MIQRPDIRLLDRVVDARDPDAGIARFQHWRVIGNVLIAAVRYPGRPQSVYIPASDLLYVQLTGAMVPADEARRGTRTLARLRKQKRREKALRRQKYLREYMREYKKGVRRRKAKVACPVEPQPQPQPKPATPGPRRGNGPSKNLPWLQWLSQDCAYRNREPTPTEERISEIFISERAALQRRLRLQDMTAGSLADED